VTAAIYLSRKITTVHNLRGIPKTFVAVKDGDVPKVILRNHLYSFLP
jgi:hypothetical protein